MNSTTILISAFLLLLAIGLWILSRKKLIGNETLDTIEKIGSIVAVIIAILVLVIPSLTQTEVAQITPNPTNTLSPSNTPTTTHTPTPLPTSTSTSIPSSPTPSSTPTETPIPIPTTEPNARLLNIRANGEKSFTDEFSIDSGEWVSLWGELLSEVTISIDNVLNIDVITGGEVVRETFTNDNIKTPDGNYIISMETSDISGCDYGIVFKGTLNNEYYYYFVGRDQFGLNYVDPDVRDQLVERTYLPEGIGTIGNIDVLVEENEYSLFINRQLVWVYYDETPLTGKRVGIEILVCQYLEEATFTFDTFEIFSLNDIDAEAYDYSNIYLQQGIQKFNNASYDESIFYFNLAEEKGAHIPPDILYMRGQAYYERNSEGDYSLAIDELSNAIDQGYEDLESAYYYRGLANYFLDDNEAALHDFESAVTQGSIGAIRLIGWVFNDEGNYEAAVEQYTQAIDAGLTSYWVYYDRAGATKRFCENDTSLNTLDKDTLATATLLDYEQFLLLTEEVNDIEERREEVAEIISNLTNNGC